MVLSDSAAQCSRSAGGGEEGLLGAPPAPRCQLGVGCAAGTALRSHVFGTAAILFPSWEALAAGEGHSLGAEGPRKA